MSGEKHASVRPSPVSGNGLFADESFKEGETILSLARPLVAVLDLDRIPDTCANCFTWTAIPSAVVPEDAPPTVQACTGCRKVKYCSRRCQSKHWKLIHKYECKHLSKVSDLPHALRAAAHLLLLMKEKQLSEAQKEAVLQLERHDEIDLKDMSDKTSGMPDFLMWNGILRLAGGSTPSYFAAGLDVDTPKMLWRTVVNNSLTLVTSTFDALGIALDPLLCAANHSCAPNALVVFDGPRVSLRSLVPIAPDEEVFIAYVDTTNPFSMRQVELKERFHFTCACSKCRLGPTLPEDRFLRPANELEKKWDKLGGKCYEDHPLSKDPRYYLGPSVDERRLAAVQGLAFDHLEKGKSCERVKEAIRQYESGMRVCYQSKMFAITRQPYPALRQELFVRMLSEGNYGIAFLQAAKTYFKIDPVLYPQRFHPVRVVHTWTLLMLMVYMLQNYEDPHSVQLLGAGFDFVTVIWRLINEVKDLVPKSHGKSQFKDGVEAKYNEIRSEMMRGEGYIKRLEEGIDTQWRRFVAFADALEY